jgi:anti-sigma-K factor RskA
MNSENHVLDLIPGYALDSLNQEENQRAAEHLSECASCRAELEAYRRVVDQFYLAVPEASPAPRVKQNLLNGLAGKSAPAVPTRSVSAWARLGNWTQRAAPVWAFASLFLLVILSAGNLWLLQRVNQLEFASQSNFRMLVLAGTDKAPKASGLLVMSHDGDMGTLVVDGLPRLDEAHQYQLWLMDNGNRVNGGVFSVSDEGYGALRIAAVASLKGFSSFGITIEPAGGSAGPTGDKVLQGNL